MTEDMSANEKPTGANDALIRDLRGAILRRFVYCSPNTMDDLVAVLAAHNCLPACTRKAETERDAAFATIARVRAWGEEMKHFGCDHEATPPECGSPTPFFYMGDRVRGMFDGFGATLDGDAATKGKQ